MEDPLLCRKETERSLLSQEMTRIVRRVGEDEKDIIQCFQNPGLSPDWSRGLRMGKVRGGLDGGPQHRGRC